MCGSLHGTLRGMYNYKRVTVVQNAPDHKQRTLEPPVLSWRTLTAYAPLRAEGSESVPAVVCAFCATSLYLYLLSMDFRELKYLGLLLR